TVEERACFANLHIGAAEFRRMATFDDTAELGAERLLAVADAEDRHARIEHRLRGARASLGGDRSRATGKDHALGLHLVECRGGILERMDLTIDAGLANAARNQLRHLAAEIDNEDAVGMGCLGHGEPLEKSCPLCN